MYLKPNTMFGKEIMHSMEPLKGHEIYFNAFAFSHLYSWVIKLYIICRHGAAINMHETPRPSGRGGMSGNV